MADFLSDGPIVIPQKPVDQVGSSSDMCFVMSVWNKTWAINYCNQGKLSETVKSRKQIKNCQFLDKSSKLIYESERYRIFENSFNLPVT